MFFAQALKVGSRAENGPVCLQSDPARHRVGLAWPGLNLTCFIHYSQVVLSLTYISLIHYSQVVLSCASHKHIYTSRHQFILSSTLYVTRPSQTSLSNHISHIQHVNQVVSTKTRQVLKINTTLIIIPNCLLYNYHWSSQSTVVFA